MTTFEEELESERYTHDHETIAQVLRRVEKERPENPRQTWLRKAREAGRMKATREAQS